MSFVVRGIGIVGLKPRTCALASRDTVAFVYLPENGLLSTDAFRQKEDTITLRRYHFNSEIGPLSCSRQLALTRLVVSR